MTIRERNFLFLIALLLPAYSAAGCGLIPTARPLFDMPPTPALDLAGTYTAGRNDIPPGKYLAVEAWTNSDGKSSTGICPYAAMVDFPMYGMRGDELQSFVEPDWEYSANNPGPPDLSKAVGFFGNGYSNSGDMGGGASSHLSVIESLPYNPDNSIFTIFSAAADGTIVVQISSQVYRLKAGERWVQYWESQPDENCHKLDTGTFTNYGLLDGNQITIAGTLLAPAFTPTP